MLSMDLSNIEEELQNRGLSQEQIAKAKTLFFKDLSLNAHRFYGGKMQTVPMAGVYGFNWFNVWYTPGVSKISTTIRDSPDAAFELSNKGNLVAVVSDSTRVLGDGDCSPPGGLGVMEGKAFLMKYLGGIDATALCIDSRNKNGEHDPDKIIDFVKMVQPSFGAVNLEDISQPNCYKVLDVLREECDIPVWHDDAQGTASVTFAGLLNALKLADKRLEDIKIVLLGAGASNTTIARIILASGASPENVIIFDSRGSLHKDRMDIECDARFYRKWELCQMTNPRKITSFSEAMTGADVLIALSTPGPDTIKKEDVRRMAPKAIVFACANPVPEIYPYAAKEAGAFIVATGRGDFPNQVNNSVGFPGILKGSLLVRARKISDGMAIAAAISLAKYAESRGISPDNILPTMEEPGVFPQVAADVAMQAIRENLARVNMKYEEVLRKAEEDIQRSRALVEAMMREGFIKQPPRSVIEDSFQLALQAVLKGE